jgi:hypothetical protein
VTLPASCDLRCAWCNYRGLPADASGAGLEPVRSELLRLRQAGHVNVGVGLLHTEPTRHPLLPDVVRLARDVGFRDVTLSTSGVRLADRAYVSALARSGLSRVILTVVGLESPLGDLLLGAVGASAAKLAAIDNVLAEGLGLCVVAMLCRPALRELERDLAALGRMVAGTPAMLHGLIPGAVPSLAPARVAALWPRYEEVAWLAASLAVPPSFTVQCAEMPPCVRRRIPRVTGAQADRPGSGVTYARPAASCGACDLAPGCLGVETSYLEMVGGALDVAWAPCAPPATDLAELRRLLQAGGGDAAAGQLGHVGGGEAWRVQAVARLGRRQAGDGPLIAGYRVEAIRHHPLRIDVSMRCGPDAVALQIAPRELGEGWFLSGQVFALCYDRATPPTTPARRRLATAMLRVLEGTAVQHP